MAYAAAAMNGQSEQQSPQRGHKATKQLKIVDFYQSLKPNPRGNGNGIKSTNRSLNALKQNKGTNPVKKTSGDLLNDSNLLKNSPQKIKRKRDKMTKSSKLKKAKKARMSPLKLHPVVRDYTHLIAFDFDQTLSCVDVWGGGFQPAVDLFGGEQRVNVLHQFLSYLKEAPLEKGWKYRIVIISYNLRNIISRRLKELKMDHFFEHIYDRKDVDKNGGYEKGKGNLIRKLAKKWNIDFERNCLMIDDMQSVIWNCHCLTVQVSKFRGMHKQEMVEMCSKLDLEVPHFVNRL